MPHWPQTGCSVIVERGGKVLLVKRGKEPFMGYWSLPGGGQEPGETLEDCARRELFEETGLTADSLRLVGARDRKGEAQDGSLAFHFVILTFIAEEVSGEAQASSDATELGWFTRKDMKYVDMTPETEEFLADVLGNVLA